MRTLRLGNVCTKIGSGATPRGGSDVYISTGIALIRSQNVYNDGFRYKGLAFIGERHAAELESVEVCSGDVLLNITGDSVARTCRAPAEVLPARVNQHVAIIRPDPAALDPRYLHYFLVSPTKQASMLSLAGGGATRNALTKGMIENFEIPAPPIEEQQAVGEVLGSLDDKIEQNRRTGQALGELARKTFKAWFVDFEPVKAKAAGAAGFPGMPSAAFAALPDHLTDSGVGPLPQGWEVSNIGTVAQRIAMGPFGSDIKTDNFVSDGVPVIRGGNLTDGFVDRDFVFLTEAKADQLANANAFPGDIVITHRGTLGQIGLIPIESRYKRYVVSQSQLLIRPNAAMLPSHYLYLFLTSSLGQHELLANRSQTGVPAISRPTTSLKAISLILPQRPIVDAFESFASALFNARVAAEQESHKLAALRDYLLPKLLSGRVRVDPAAGDRG